MKQSLLFSLNTKLLPKTIIVYQSPWFRSYMICLLLGNWSPKQAFILLRAKGTERWPDGRIKIWVGRIQPRSHPDQNPMTCATWKDNESNHRLVIHSPHPHSTAFRLPLNNFAHWFQKISSLVTVTIAAGGSLDTWINGLDWLSSTLTSLSSVTKRNMSTRSSPPISDRTVQLLCKTSLCLHEFRSTILTETNKELRCPRDVCDKIESLFIDSQNLGHLFKFERFSQRN